MAELSEQEQADIEMFEEEGEMSDGLFARSVLIGAAVGVPVVGLLVWGLFSLSDIPISNRAIVGLAVWSALWAGLLLGGVLGLGVRLIQLESKVHSEDGH